MFKNFCKKIEGCAGTLVEFKSHKLDDKLFARLPGGIGVYVFYYKGKPFYVGVSKHLRTRIMRQHLADRGDIGSSSLRKWVVRDYVNSYREVRPWLMHNCRLRFVEVESYDEAKALEAMLVCVWRGKYKLMNK